MAGAWPLRATGGSYHGVKSPEVGSGESEGVVCIVSNRARSGRAAFVPACAVWACCVCAGMHEMTVVQDGLWRALRGGGPGSRAKVHMERGSQSDFRDRLLLVRSSLL